MCSMDDEWLGPISSTPKDLKGRAESVAAFLSYNVCDKCGSLTHQCEGAAFTLEKVFGKIPIWRAIEREMSGGTLGGKWLLSVHVSFCPAQDQALRKDRH